jgi:hypothetical protein
LGRGMHFDVCGPFRIPRNQAKTLIDCGRLSELSDEVERSCPGLTIACGCYVFVIRAGKGYRPWYVGQTKKKALLKEAFNPSNINKFNVVLNDQAGTPMIFFVPMLTKSGNGFRKPNDRLESINFLEKWLIAEAFRKNPKLINLQNTKYLKDLHVTGIFNAARGEATSASSELGRAIW